MIHPSAIISAVNLVQSGKVKVKSRKIPRWAKSLISLSDWALTTVYLCSIGAVVIWLIRLYIR
jgi:hypothetical protein